jgi:hypothetical protein
MVFVGDRYFPATALGGKLYVDDTPQDEAVVDMLVAHVGHKKVRTAEELGEVVNASERGLPAIRLWIHESLQDEAWRTLKEQNGFRSDGEGTDSRG